MTTVRSTQQAPASANEKLVGRFALDTEVEYVGASEIPAWDERWTLLPALDAPVRERCYWAGHEFLVVTLLARVERYNKAALFAGSPMTAGDVVGFEPGAIRELTVKLDERLQACGQLTLIKERV